MTENHLDLTPQKEEESECEVSIIESKSIDLEQFQTFVNTFDKLYLRQLGNAMKQIYSFSEALKKGKKAIELIESILTFKKEYLTIATHDSPSN